MTVENDSSAEFVIECRDLKKHFSLEQGLIDTVLGREREYVHAVDGVDLRIEPGEMIGIAGESGCGKSTLGRTLIRLVEPTSGQISFNGRDVTKATGPEYDSFRRNVNMIFQDPFESLNPRLKIFDSVKEPLIVHDVGTEEKRYERVIRALEQAELQPAEEFMDRYPHELSGGENQRVAIARALVMEPEFIVADEPVSMLDVSIRASILNLLKKLNRELGVSILFISHDLSLLRQVCEEINIMYLGRIIETGGTEAIINDPTHPYTQALLKAAPEPDPSKRRESVDIEGSIPDPIDVPDGCRFKDRCPERREICDAVDPPLLRSNGKRVACHPHYQEEDRQRMAERYRDATGDGGDPLATPTPDHD